MYDIRRAKIDDVPGIHKLVNSFASKGLMLPRSLSELYENIRDFFLAEDEGEIIACAALHINWEDLAEVKSLAVIESKQKIGLGKQLVEICVEDAKKLGASTVFCLTYQPGFFEKQGFKPIDKSELPHKVWGECYKCPKFPNCDENALIYHFEEALNA